MRRGKTKGSQLLIFPDGTLYHIDLKRGDNLPQNVLLVGAASRVDAIAALFDKVTFRHQNKIRPEFYIKAGWYKGVPMAVMSIGIGVSNVEIAMTEFHALFEYDLASDSWAVQKPDINFIRIGTCGTTQREIGPGSLAISEFSLGLDNLGKYYPTTLRAKTAQIIEKQFRDTAVGKVNPLSYCSSATTRVAELLRKTALALGESDTTVFSGITVTAPGFYAPEGRQIGRITTALTIEQYIASVAAVHADGTRVINMEMETSALFRIGWEHLGYNVGAICLVIDNTLTDEVLEFGSAFERERSERCARVALETMRILAGGTA